VVIISTNINIKTCVKADYYKKCMLKLITVKLLVSFKKMKICMF